MNRTESLFETLKKDEPKVGDELTTLDGSHIRLQVRTKSVGGQVKKQVYCRAAVDVDAGGWVLTNGEVGLVCLILPQAQKRLIRDSEQFFLAKTIQIVRFTPNGGAALCEVIE